MANYKAQAMELIETRILTGTSASEAFVLDHDLVTNYSSIVLYFAIKVTATLDAELIVNGVTSAYYTYTIKASDQAITAHSNLAHLMLGSALTTANFTAGKLEIFNGIGASPMISYTGFIGNGQGITAKDIKGACNSTIATTITDILITTSTSTFAVGTKFSLYGVRA